MNISTTIKQKYFDEILSGKKNIEYREDTDYWRKRLEGRTIERIRLLCGRRSLSCNVIGVHHVPTPDDLRQVVKTPQCWAIQLDHDTLVATIFK